MYDNLYRRVPTINEIIGESEREAGLPLGPLTKPTDAATHIQVFIDENG